MKDLKIGVILTVVICLLSLISCSKRSPKVLIIARESSDNMNMMIQDEVIPIQETIRAAGFAVDIASESMAKLGSGSITLQPNLKLSDVKIRDYAGLIIPCMAAGGTPNAIPEIAVDIVKNANAIGLPIAAQQSGVEILGKAGVLLGKHYAIGEGSESPVPGGIYIGTGVVRDGKVTTSGTCPFLHSTKGLRDGTAEMTENFIESMIP
jgi:putative intracellular protease/amidase